LSNTTISSFMQPNGTEPLSGTTNSSGYVTFTNITTGRYSFSILKDGYEQTNQTVNLQNNPVNMTLALVAVGSGSASSDGGSFIPTIIAVVVVVVLIVVVVMVLKRRSRASMKLP